MSVIILSDMISHNKNLEVRLFLYTMDISNRVQIYFKTILIFFYKEFLRESWRKLLKSR